MLKKVTLYMSYISEKRENNIVALTTNCFIHIIISVKKNLCLRRELNEKNQLVNNV